VEPCPCLSPRVRYPITVFLETEFHCGTALFGGCRVSPLAPGIEQKQSWPTSASNQRLVTLTWQLALRLFATTTAAPLTAISRGILCRVQVHYPRHAWTLGVYFLASTFDRAMKRLEDSLDFLQRQERSCGFWGVDRAEDMGFSAEFLKEAGLYLDRRNEFPRKAPVSR